jgi:hypothetical protein
MARKTRKITSTRKPKGATKPAATNKEPGTTHSQKDDEGWAPLGAAAKKVAKGAVKGAAKEVLK